ncbi:phosphomannose isomerase type II C-terminal cupin domain [Aestuariivirga sp.]|uniref:phosphomannose isomerase type II C-terminal cupin domain n=1 Tax=Aestuariivirga sp. TaxID=2650926 RepID=UPI00391D738A
MEERRQEGSNPTFHRPWGSFSELARGPGFLVKELCVRPGARLSLQRHRFRAEHWVCVAGQGVALCGGEEILLVLGGSLTVPAGAVHRLTNSGSQALRIIETQTGERLSEDDIDRLADDWGRV